MDWLKSIGEAAGKGIASSGIGWIVNRNENRKIVNRANQFAENMANTGIDRQVQALERNGINKMLAVGGMGGASSPMSMASSSTGDIGAEINADPLAIQATNLIKKQTEKAEAEIKNIKQENIINSTEEFIKSQATKGLKAVEKGIKNTGSFGKKFNNFVANAQNSNQGQFNNAWDYYNNIKKGRK